MLLAPRRAKHALFAAFALFCASTVTTTAAQNCVPFNASTTAGYPDDVSIDYPTYFACEDGSFLTAVGATYYNYIYSLSWMCSDGEEIGSISSDSTADESVSFSVGITGLQTGVEDGALPWLSEMYFSGYDVDSGGADGISFSWKGPLGEFDDETVLLPDNSTSDCGSDAFATGVTVWSSTNFVYGVMLECATVTDTCHPLNYPDSLIEDGSSYISPTDDLTTAYTYDPSGGTSTLSTDDTSFTSSDDGSSYAPPSDGSSSTYSPEDGSSSSSSSPNDASSSSSRNDGSKSASSTGESSSDSTTKVIVITTSVAGALVLIAIVIGVTVCCLCSRHTRKSETRQRERETPAAASVGSASVVPTVQGDADAGTTLQPQAPVIPPPTLQLQPPPEPSYCHESPPPPFRA